MERAEKVPAVMGSLVWKAADLSSLSDCLYGQLMPRERKKKMSSKISIKSHKSPERIKTHYSGAILNETNHLKVAMSLEFYPHNDLMRVETSSIKITHTYIW